MRKHFHEKRHWVVRLGAERARWLYVFIAATAYTWVIGAVIVGALPRLSVVSLASAAMSALAARDVLNFANHPQRLVHAIRLTIGAALLHGSLLAFTLACAYWLS